MEMLKSNAKNQRLLHVKRILADPIVIVLIQPPVSNVDAWLAVWETHVEDVLVVINKWLVQTTDVV